MRKCFVWICVLLSPISASAQWAVLDEEVRKILVMINRVDSIGDKRLQEFELQSVLSADFSTISVANPERYVGTVSDCGDETLNSAHYKACLGLRNLRLKTLEQTEAIVLRIQDRRTKIKQLVEAGRTGSSSSGPTLEAGQLQRYQFELQGVQAQMQNDAMELEALRYGYKQREKMYEVQMAEARRSTDTRPPSATGGVSLNLGPVKFR